ncbi:hypothetical protein BC2926_38850 [Bacillus cereus]|nr:hypothetical protein BC2926_38850 [Bacillus cereus]
MKLNYQIGNDNGNHEQDIVINGKMYQFANVYSVVTNSIEDEDISAEEMIPNLLDRLYVTIQSRSINGAHEVFVGKRALEDGENVRNMNIKLGKKHKEDLPLITTLANLAGVAVKETFSKKNKIVKDIEISVDMTTALPASQWTKETANEFSSRFMDTQHLVTVHLGKTDILVKVNFVFVKTVKEGVVTLFGIIEDEKGKYRNDDLFDEFSKEYNLGKIDGSYFKDKKILHADIGDGTSEYAVTTGYKTDGRTHGRPHGIGHALESAIKKFKEKWDIEVSRQEFAEYVKKEGSKYHPIAIDSLAVAKRELAKTILEELQMTSKDLKHDYDAIVVYGGGSIQLKDVLYKELKEFCDSVQVKLLWIDKKYAVTMNARGLEIFTKVALPQFKEKALQV